MKSLTNNRWFRRLGLASVAALSLVAVTMTTTAAQAHGWGGFPIGHHAFFGGHHYSHSYYRHWR
jgi:hypothetical protein